MKLRSLLAACAAAALTVAVGPSAAEATCYSSTPTTQSFSDSIVDGDSGLAPEIGSISLTVDGSCHVTAGADLANRPSGLIQDDSVIVFLDTDGNPATGSQIMGGADKAVGFLGSTGADLPPLLGTWDGTTISFSGGRSVAATNAAAFTDTIDGLGIAPGANLGIGAGSSWAGIFNSYFDFAPNAMSSLFRTVVSYSTVAPPTVAAQPAPFKAAVAVPTAAAPVRTQSADSTASRTCSVPAVKKQSLVRAKKTISHAQCALGRVRGIYSSKVKVGRVVRTSPAAGALTSKSLVVYVSRGKKRRRARASSIRDAQSYLNAVVAASTTR